MQVALTSLARRHWRNAALVSVALPAAGFSALVAVRWLKGDIGHDFLYYYAAAEVGRTYGWSHLYDLHLQQRAFAHLTHETFAPFVNPPPVAWLALPFTYLAYPIAVRLWTALLFGCLVATIFLAPARDRRERVVLVLITLAVYPFLWPARDGQVVTLIALVWVLTVRSLRGAAGTRPGLATALTALKPQVALAAPGVFLVLRRWRALVVLVLAVGTVALLSLATLGTDGTRDYLADLHAVGSFPAQHRQTVVWLLGSRLEPVLQALLLAATVGLVWIQRKRGPEAVVAVTAVGSVLASPYVNNPDLGLLAVPFWLLWSRAVTLERIAVGVLVVGLGVAWQSPYVLEVPFLVLLTIAARWSAQSQG